MSALIVAAHPDDEVLGCGGTAALLSQQGVSVRACLLSSSVTARTSRPQPSLLIDQTRRAQRLLGMGEPILGDFPNISFNTIPHLQLVQFIEGAIRATGATLLFTHHPGDLNDDHRSVSLACQAAARLHQRTGTVPRLHGLYFIEVLSSSDWAFPSHTRQFEPVAFVELGDSFLTKKLNALAAYEGVIRAYPHARSVEAVRGLAAYRGGQAGLLYAEAFQAAYVNLLDQLGGITRHV